MSGDFDFWVGEWDVVNQADGTLAGTNVITPELGGRVLVERYSTPRGFAGMSLNGYDQSAGCWHQCWMDSTGGVLDLYGGLVGIEMVMKGTSSDEDGEAIHERITWTPNPDGSVRQHWERSAGGDAEWVTVFDGLYRRPVADGLSS